MWFGYNTVVFGCDPSLAQSIGDFSKAVIRPSLTVSC